MPSSNEAAFEFADALSRLASIVAGYRRQLIDAGFSPEVAGAMAQDLHAGLVPLFLAPREEP